MAARERDGWLGDFSFVLSRDHFRSVRRDPQYEVFSGSKPLAFLWLVVVAAAGGALGGTLVSGALWGPWWQVPAWIATLVATTAIAVPPTLALSGQPLGFMVGWSLFWGLLIGAVAMWGAQLDGAGWAYGIAGGIGFFVGITQGVYEPDDLQGHDGFFAISTIAAPAGACLAAWLYRHGLLGERGLASAALAGTLAGLILLGPSMAYFFSRLDNLVGLKRLASLLLHRDETVGEAIVPLNAAIRLAPGDASLFDRRALAHALSGSEAAAERDWARAAELDPARSHRRSAGAGWRFGAIGRARLRRTSNRRGAPAQKSDGPGSGWPSRSLSWATQPKRLRRWNGCRKLNGRRSTSPIWPKPCWRRETRYWPSEPLPMRSTSWIRFMDDHGSSVPKPGGCWATSTAPQGITTWP
jgi:hypothetical protein